MLLWYYLFAINLLAFVLYWHDKRSAIYHARRTPEYVLLLSGFFGGTLGAFLAQRILRHKNRKASFQFKFWLLTLLQIGLIIWPPMALRLALRFLLTHSV